MVEPHRLHGRDNRIAADTRASRDLHPQPQHRRWPKSGSCSCCRFGSGRHDSDVVCSRRAQCCACCIPDIVQCGEVGRCCILGVFGAAYVVANANNHQRRPICCYSRFRISPRDRDQFSEPEDSFVFPFDFSPICRYECGTCQSSVAGARSRLCSAGHHFQRVVFPDGKWPAPCIAAGPHLAIHPAICLRGAVCSAGSSCSHGRTHQLVGQA
ncbi:MAG: hypothetical protein RJA15_1019 [Actinomycetota bacterium]